VAQEASHDLTVENLITDFALLKLTNFNDVECNIPIPELSFAEINVSKKIYIIGHPFGLPLKVSDPVHVTPAEKSESFPGLPENSVYKCSLSAFVCNSGSPAFYENSNTLCGIYTRGTDDFRLDDNQKITISEKLNKNYCAQGEVILSLKGACAHQKQLADILKEQGIKI